MFKRFTRPITILSIAAMLAVAVALPATASAATTDSLPSVEQVGDAPSISFAPGEQSYLDLPDCPFCVVVLGGVIGGIITAAITNPNKTAEIARDAVQFVANAYENACNSNACHNPGQR